eukprot:scaffold124532_cov45-Phaeocystis_antarctica.AAC.1
MGAAPLELEPASTVTVTPAPVGRGRGLRRSGSVSSRLTGAEVEEGHMHDSPDVHAMRSKVRRGSGRIRDAPWRALPAIEQQGAMAHAHLREAVTKVKSMGRFAAAGRAKESAVAATLERAAVAAGAVA